jgi:uroporphyrinogen-III synthase
MSDSPGERPLRGRRIALLETREADRLGAMLRAQGAEVVSCPTVIITDIANSAPLDAWIDRFIAEPCHDLILLTGEGLTRLHALAAKSGKDAAFVSALHRTRTITRGPKPARVLRQLGLEPQLRAAEPTTEGVIATLGAENLRGRRVGVQLYPGSPDRLPAYLAAAGAMPDPVTPYEYAPYAPDAALAGLIERIAVGEIDAIAFTSASQVYRFFGLAETRGLTRRLHAGLQKTAIAAIGPKVATALEQHGAAAGIVPADSFFMKPLVTAITAALG